MSETTVPAAGATAPAASPAPTPATTATAATTPPANEGTRVNMTPAQLKSRLDEARQAGAKDAGDGERKRRKELEREVERYKSEAETLAPLANRLIERESASLTEQQRTYLATLGGPKAQLDKLEEWRAIGLLEPKPAAAPKADPPPPAAAQKPDAMPLPAPASTSPNIVPPKPAIPSPTVDHNAAYESLVKTNPILAARYRLLHAEEINAAQRAIRTGR